MKENAPEGEALAVDVALSPALATRALTSGRRIVCVVVDVIRATTSLCVVFERGCSAVSILPDVESARIVAARAPGRFLLGGEQGGVAPPGFDFGNSPTAYAQSDLRGRELLFVSTNGTVALSTCGLGFAVFAGAYRNASAVAQAALASALHARRLQLASSPSAEDHDACDILIVCSGLGGHPAYDDTLCAGYLAQQVRQAAEREGRVVTLGEGARIAQTVAESIPQTEGAVRAALASSHAGQSISALGLASDLAWCAEVDATEIVPMISGHDAEQAHWIMTPWAGEWWTDR